MCSWHGNSNNNRDTHYKAVSLILMIMMAGIWEAAIEMVQFQDDVESKAGGFYVEGKVRDDSDVFDLSN